MRPRQPAAKLLIVMYEDILGFCVFEAGRRKERRGERGAGVTLSRAAVQRKQTILQQCHHYTAAVVVVQSRQYVQMHARMICVITEADTPFFFCGRPLTSGLTQPDHTKRNPLPATYCRRYKFSSSNCTHQILYSPPPPPGGEPEHLPWPALPAPSCRPCPCIHKAEYNTRT